MARAGSLTVFHGSDFQCGAPFLPGAAEAMLRLAEEIAPDLAVISGDLTQRAKAREFRQARATLDGFGAVPLVITPGNHDVPLYRFWERIAAPYRQWTRFAGAALDTVTRLPGATVVALNSSAPRRAIVNGRLDGHQLDFAREAFESGGAEDLRIVVTHHHFVPVPDGRGGRPMPGATGIVRAFEELGVDVVLGGHVHQIHMSDSRVLTGSDPHRSVPLIASGTTTSSRGRGAESDWNSLCVLRISEEALEVTPYRRAPSARDFEASAPVIWPRRPTMERAR
jgi:3',5'-cyclic AMP phosphodiesterase CpdA